MGIAFHLKLFTPSWRIVVLKWNLTFSLLARNQALLSQMTREQQFVAQVCS